MNVLLIMEDVTKYVITPMVAISAHATLVMLLVLIIITVMVCLLYIIHLVIHTFKNYKI